MSLRMRDNSSMAAKKSAPSSKRALAKTIAATKRLPVKDVAKVAGASQVVGEKRGVKASGVKASVVNNSVAKKSGITTAVAAKVHRTKSVAKPAMTKPASTTKPVHPVPAKQAAKEKTAQQKTAQQKTVAPVRAKRATASAPVTSWKENKKRGSELDFSAFPPEALLHEQRWICLACILDVFTRQLGMAAVTAQSQIRHYAPTVAELTAHEPPRPYLGAEADREPCRWCAAPARWHVMLDVHRIESGKGTDAARRELVKSLGAGESFLVVEEKATQRDAFYDWLQHTSARLNLDDPNWLIEATHHYLARTDPKTDWTSIFNGLAAVRRSRRVEEGWECEGGRLYLAPRLFDEVLLMQYLLSRSHRSGGLTFEGRLTLPELIRRLRGAGYLRAAGVASGNAEDAFEQIVEILGGGETGMKFYYVVDRRRLLEKLKELKSVRVPRAKASHA